MNRNVFLFIATVIYVFIGICLSTTACTDSKKGEFIFAYQDRVADAISIVAVEKGFFKEQGLSLVLKRFSSGPECMEVLTTGNADFATMGDTTAIIVSSQKGASFKIACSLGGGEHRHRVIVSKYGGINRISELEGKRIGVKKGTSTHGGLMQFAKYHAIDLNDEMVDISPSLQLTALAAGELDAIVASEPTPSQAEAGDYGRELATLGNLNNTYPILLMVRANFAEQNPEVVIGVINALAKAKDYMENHFDETAKILSRLTDLEVTVIKKAMGSHCYGVGLSDETLESLDAMSNFLRDIGRISELPDFNVVIDKSYLEHSYKTFK